MVSYLSQNGKRTDGAPWADDASYARNAEQQRPAVLAITPEAVIQRAKLVLNIEAAAVSALVERVDSAFLEAVLQVLSLSGHVVVSGIGKSGYIARKIAATLSSTGTPAFFLHPAEGCHGDLGALTAEDLLFMISHSGESHELLAILPYACHRNIPVIALTGNPTSTLAQAARIHLDAAVAEEACPLGLAPTASTTAALALGDAFAVALLEARAFKTEDFALTHPAGRLGRRLCLRVSDVMHSGADLPTVTLDAAIPEALEEMTCKRLGCTAIVDTERVLKGIFTDGDLRRAFHRFGDLRHVPVSSAMTLNPRTALPNQLAVDAAASIQDDKINVLLVIDEAKRLLGIVHFHDLLRAGIL